MVLPVSASSRLLLPAISCCCRSGPRWARIGWVNVCAPISTSSPSASWRTSSLCHGAMLAAIAIRRPAAELFQGLFAFCVGQFDQRFVDRHIRGLPWTRNWFPGSPVAMRSPGPSRCGKAQARLEPFRLRLNSSSRDAGSRMSFANSSHHRFSGTPRYPGVINTVPGTR